MRKFHIITLATGADTDMSRNLNQTVARILAAAGPGADVHLVNSHQDAAGDLVCIFREYDTHKGAK